jgi:hypothetical protein
MKIGRAGTCDDSESPCNHAQLSDIDSQRIVLHIRDGKRRKARDPCSARSCSMNCTSNGVASGAEAGTDRSAKATRLRWPKTEVTRSGVS